MNNTTKPFTENDDRSGTKCHKDEGIFDHAKPHNISSYNSRAAPSPHTLMRASAPPHLASPARRACAPCTPRPRRPTHTSPPQAIRLTTHKGRSRWISGPAFGRNSFRNRRGRSPRFEKLKGGARRRAAPPRKAEREGAQRRTAPLTKGRLQDERGHHGDRQSRD